MNPAQPKAPSAHSSGLRRVLARRPVRALLALIVCSALGAVPAYAVWSVLGTGSTTATARSLATPAAPSVASPTVSSLVVSGTLPSGQLPTTTYAVKRGSATVCTPSATPWSCTDTGLSASTVYSYTVVATLGSWTATSSSTSATTSAPACTTPDTYTVNAPVMTAGATASVTLTARKCDGTVDTSYTGSKALSWASVAASPSGKAAALPATASFSAGTAAVPVTLYAAGTATLAPTTGAVTGSTTVPVAAGSPKNLALTEAATGGVAVGLTCGLLSEPAADRGCVASPVTAPNGKHAWTAKVNLLDTWGNPAAAASALMVTVTTSQGESGSGSFGASATTAPISVDIGNKATGVAMTFTANGISTLTVTNAT